MLSEEKLEALLNKIENRIDAVNRFYLKKVGEQIKEIGKLSPASVHKLIQIRKAGTSVEEINKALAEATGKNIGDIKKLYREALNETYADYELMAILKGVPLPPLSQNKQMQLILEAVYCVTEETMKNWSNTTNISATYKELVSDAIQAAVSGVSDYNSAMRRALEKAALEGLRVTYESGHTRRLDTAIRMNVVDGVKHIQQEAQRILGEQIGADGVELTAHPNSAPDHEPVQGRQFTIAEFEKMQSGQDFQDIDGNHYKGFKRPIGEWNCRHFAYSIVLGVAKRRYSDEQLEEWRRANNEGCEIDGKHYTKYEASQLMRQLETKIRQQKDVANAARASGDDVLRRKAQQKITQLTAKYKEVAEKSGLRTRFERTYVKGFKDVKLDLPKVAKAPNKILQETIADIRLKGIIPQGADIENVRVIAGYGTSTELRYANKLAEEIGGSFLQWQKKSGIIQGEYNSYEVHWDELDGKQYRIKLKGVRSKSK